MLWVRLPTLSCCRKMTGCWILCGDCRTPTPEILYSLFAHAEELNLIHWCQLPVPRCLGALSNGGRHCCANSSVLTHPFGTGPNDWDANSVLSNWTSSLSIASTWSLGCFSPRCWCVHGMLVFYSSLQCWARRMRWQVDAEEFHPTCLRCLYLVAGVLLSNSTRHWWPSNDRYRLHLAL